MQEVVTARETRGSRYGLGRCKRTLVPGLVAGCARTTSLLRPVWFFGSRSPRRLVFVLSLISLMLSSVRLRCPTFVGLVTLWLPLISFLVSLVLVCLPQDDVIDLHSIAGQDLYEVAMAKRTSATVWMVGFGMKFRLCRYLVSLVLLFSWVWLESTSVWLQGLHDAYIAMIPKADGDSTSAGHRPLCVLVVVYRLWASLRLSQIKDWVTVWVVFSIGHGVLSVDAWFFPLLWTL